MCTPRVLGPENPAPSNPPNRQKRLRGREVFQRLVAPGEYHLYHLHHWAW